jgi:hypothetical protein
MPRHWGEDWGEGYPHRDISGANRPSLNSCLHFANLDVGLLINFHRSLGSPKFIRLAKARVSPHPRHSLSQGRATATVGPGPQRSEDRTTERAGKRMDWNPMGRNHTGGRGWIEQRPPAGTVGMGRNARTATGDPAPREGSDPRNTPTRSVGSLEGYLRPKKPNMPWATSSSMAAVISGKTGRLSTSWEASSDSGSWPFLMPR